MDSGALSGLEPSVHPSNIASPAKGLLETQQIGETQHVTAAAENLSTYNFSRQRLRQAQTDSSREPLVLVACGLSPLHMFFQVLSWSLSVDLIFF